MKVEQHDTPFYWTDEPAQPLVTVLAALLAAVVNVLTLLLRAVVAVLIALFVAVVVTVSPVFPTLP